MYSILYEELSAFGLLPGCHHTEDFTTTRTGKFGMALFEALPKASDVSEKREMPLNGDSGDDDDSYQASKSRAKNTMVQKGSMT